MLPSEDEGWTKKKARIEGPGGTSIPPVVARRKVSVEALLPAAAREVKDVASTDVTDERDIVQCTPEVAPDKVEGTNGDASDVECEWLEEPSRDGGDAENSAKLDALVDAIGIVDVE
jgi:hypothetical protein